MPAPTELSLTQTRNTMKWLNALVSGDYKQTDGYLKNIHAPKEIPGFCCLGVGCEIQNKLRERKEKDADPCKVSPNANFVFNGIGDEECMSGEPDSFWWEDTYGWKHDHKFDCDEAGVCTPIDMNDDEGFDFKEIARICFEELQPEIENHYPAWGLGDEIPPLEEQPAAAPGE